MRLRTLKEAEFELIAKNLEVRAAKERGRTTELYHMETGMSDNLETEPASGFAGFELVGKIIVAPGMIAYGEVSEGHIGEVTDDQVRQKKMEVMETGRGNRTGTEEYAEKLDEFRTWLGAMYFSLSGQISSDLERLAKNGESVWACMWRTALGSVRPGKYRQACGRAGWRGESLFFLNAVTHGTHYQRWGFNSARELQRQIEKSRAVLAYKEKEYRDEAMAVLQVGIGMGGMIVGLVGLICGLAVGLLGVFM